jgi:hypothetical protein
MASAAFYGYDFLEVKKRQRSFRRISLSIDEHKRADRASHRKTGPDEHDVSKPFHERIVNGPPDCRAERRRDLFGQSCSRQFHAFRVEHLARLGQEFERSQTLIKGMIENVQHHNSKRGDRQQRGAS